MNKSSFGVQNRQKVIQAGKLSRQRGIMALVKGFFLSGSILRTPTLWCFDGHGVYPGNDSRFGQLASVHFHPSGNAPSDIPQFHFPVLAAASCVHHFLILFPVKTSLRPLPEKHFCGSFFIHRAPPRCLAFSPIIIQGDLLFFNPIHNF